MTGRGKYARIVEFSKKLPLWEHVYEACVDAVKLELANETKDVVIDDIPDEISFDEISFDNIPF